MVEKKIIESGLEYQKIDEDIFIVYNFITEEEKTSLLDIVETEDWTELGKDEMRDLCQDQFGSSNFEELIRDGKLRYSEMYDKKISTNRKKNIVVQIYKRLAKLAPDGTFAGMLHTIQRQTKNTGLSEHRDIDMNHNYFDYSGVIYLQHAEIGGEIFFTEKNLELLPPEKSLILFDGKFLHGVKPIQGEKERYVLPTYFFKSY